MSKSHLLELTQLDEIIEVLKRSGFSDTKWYSLGLRLGLVKNTLDCIESQYRGDFDRCLMECLSCWLNKADNVVNKGGPNWISLTSSLRSMNQVAVADNVDQQKQPAYFILYRHHAALSEYLADPVYVARLLQTENLIPEEVVTNIQRKPFLSEKRKTLLTSVQGGISTDYHNLLIFSSVLAKVTGNESLANDILNDYNKAFTCTDISNDVATEDTQATSTEGKKIFVPRSMSSEFTAMRAKFGRMLYKIHGVIERNQLQINCLKSFLGYSYPDLTARLSASISINDVVCLAQEKCSLIDIKLLEEMVKEFELKEAEKHINTYKEEVEEFCQTISARLCLNETFQVTVPHNPLQCETITFVLDWDPDEHMLDDVRNLLAVAFQKLSLTVKVIVIKEGNSVIIKCCFPVHLAMLLIAQAFDNLETLKQRFGLLSLTIGYVTVWNKQSRDEEIKRDEEIQLLKQALSRKEDYTEMLAMYKKLDRGMSLELEKLKLLLKGSKEEIKALQQRTTQLSSELLEYKENYSKLMKDYENLQLKVKEHTQLEESITLDNIVSLDNTSESKVTVEDFATLEKIMKKVESIKAMSKSSRSTGRVNWDRQSVDLRSPSPQLCVTVISDLIKELPNVQHDYIRLFSSSPDSTLVMLSQLYQIQTRRLMISDTQLNEEHIYCISRCVISNNLKELHLSNTKLTNNELKTLTDALEVNTSLEKLILWYVEITEGDVSRISKVLADNKTLQTLYLINCGITDDGVKLLSSSLLHNYTLTVLDLRSNPLMSSNSIHHLVQLLSLNKTIKTLYIDSKHKSSTEQYKNYEQIKHRLHI